MTFLIASIWVNREEWIICNFTRFTNGEVREPMKMFLVKKIKRGQFRDYLLRSDKDKFISVFENTPHSCRGQKKINKKNGS